jgi:hypothetical protein
MMNCAESIKKMAADICKMHDAYLEAQQMLQVEQGVMIDIAHKLELYRTSDAERQKLATIYANAARKRRKCKEYIEMMERFANYDHAVDLNQNMAHIASEMVETKKRQEKRQYTPRSEKIRFDDAEKYDINYEKRK